MMNQESIHPFAVAQAGGDAKANFIRKTYLHLAGAILAFIGLEIAIFSTPLADQIASLVFNSGSVGWLGFLGVFMIAGWMARSMAVSGSRATQYAGLGFYVAAQALIFVPLLYIAVHYSSPDVLTNAVQEQLEVATFDEHPAPWLSELAQSRKDRIPTNCLGS